MNIRQRAEIGLATDGNDSELRGSFLDTLKGSDIRSRVLQSQGTL